MNIGIDLGGSHIAIGKVKDGKVIEKKRDWNNTNRQTEHKRIFRTKYIKIIRRITNNRGNRNNRNSSTRNNYRQQNYKMRKFRYRKLWYSRKNKNEDRRKK